MRFGSHSSCIAALWETAWPAHPNKGAYTQHELFVVWVCEVAHVASKISLLVHGDRQYTWIPTRYVADPTDNRKGCLKYRQRAQSEFCKFIVECIKHKRTYDIPSHEAAAGKTKAASASEAQVRAEVGGLKCSFGNDTDDCDVAAAAAGSDEGSSDEQEFDSNDDESWEEDQQEFTSSALQVEDT